jgi:two-component system cell cycle sensor histidine kinase/response regulator CckA
MVKKVKTSRTKLNTSKRAKKTSHETKRRRDATTTERKRLDEALRKSEIAFRSLFEASPIGTILLANRKIIKVNPALCRITGYFAEELEGQSVRIAYRDQEEFERVGKTLFEEVVQRGMGIEEAHLKLKNGSDVEGLVCMSPLDPRDLSAGVVVTVIDITERKRAEEAILWERNFSRAAMESMPDLFYMFTAQGRYLRWNKNLNVVSGHTDEEIARMTPLDLILESDRDLVNTRIREVFSTGEGSVEAHVVFKDGTPKPYFFTGRLLQFEGEPCLVGIGVDITERKRAEALLERNLRQTDMRLQISQALVGSESEEEVLDILIQQASFDQQVLTRVVTFDNLDGQQFGIVRRHNPHASGFTLVLPIGTSLPSSQFMSIANHVINQSFVSEDVALDEHVDPRARELIQEEGGTSFAAFPLTAGNEWLGILTAIAKTRGYFDEEKQNLYRTLAEQGAVALRAARLREAIRESQLRYQSLVETLSDWIWEVDQNGVYTYVSPKVQDLLGYEPEDMLGKTPFDFMPPEEAKRVTGVFASMLASQQPIVALENMCRHKDGHLVVFETSGTPFFDSDEHFRGYRGVDRDITARKQIEESLRERQETINAIIETSQEWIWAIDSQGVHTYSNPAIEKILGFRPEEIVGSLSFDLIHEDDKKMVESILQECEKNRSGWNNLLLRWRHKNGTYRYLESNAVPILNAKGDLVGFRGVDRDITERKRAEAQLERNLRETRVRLQISQALATAETEDEVLDVLIQQANIYPQAHMSIVTFEKVDSEIIGTLRRCDSLTSGVVRGVPLGTRFPASQFTSIKNYVINEPFTSEDISLDDRMDSPAREMIQRGGGTSFAAFPLTAGNEWMGIITAISKTRGYFDEEKETLYRTLAEQGAVALRAARLREAIRSSQQRLSLLIEQSPLAVIEWNLNLEVVSWNPAAERIFGYTAAEALGRTAAGLVLPATDQLHLDRFLKRIVGKKDSIHLVNTHVTKNGRRIICEWFETPFVGSDGQVIGIISLVQDITERKRSEETLLTIRTAIEGSSDAIGMSDPQGHHFYQNKAFTDLYEYATAEELEAAGGGPATYADQAVAREVFDTIMRGGSWRGEVEIISKSGRKFPVSMRADAIKDDHGRIIGLIGIHTDITERKRAEEEKAKLEDQLRQAQKMEAIGRLAGGVAHDFNNMLSVIIGYTNLIKAQLPADEPLRKDILDIERAASRSKDITSQLLAFSRKQTIAPKILRLNEIIMMMQKTLARLIGEDIDLKFYPGNDLWKIKFDPSQLEQILINLAANARDAMPEGGKLTIETANVSLDEAYCEDHIGFKPGYFTMLGVSDDGVGMDQETLAHVFEPFFTTKEFGKGTGLGLAMVYGIVKQNNGFINIYSEPAQGTAVKIYFPRSMDNEQPEHIEIEPITPQSGTVLLVEDDDMVRRMTNKMLKAIGYTVLSADKPQQALSLCETSAEPIDLLLTDVVMPLMSGKDLRKKIEAMRPGIKTIFMSGYTANMIAHRGILEKGVHLLQKPFTLNELAAKIREALGKH